MALGYDIRSNAMRAGNGGFDISTGRISRPYEGMRYWIKGYVSGGAFQVGKNVWHTIYALGSLALAGLGMYAAVEGKAVSLRKYR